MDDKLNLSKLGVAKRQLETAIDLYFDSRDPVSIHTLTAAAYQILDDVARARGIPRMNLILTMEQVFPKEMISTVLPVVRKAQNFFKHAERDADNRYDFHPGQTEFILFDACTKYPEMSGSGSPRMTAFSYWFFLQHDLPYRFPPEMQDAFGKFKTAYNDADRQEFFRDSMTVLGQFDAGYWEQGV